MKPLTAEAARARVLEVIDRIPRASSQRFRAMALIAQTQARMEVVRERPLTETERHAEYHRLFWRLVKGLRTLARQSATPTTRKGGGL